MDRPCRRAADPALRAGPPSGDSGCDSASPFVCHAQAPVGEQRFTDALHEACDSPTFGYAPAAFRCKDRAGDVYDVVELRALYTARVEYFDPDTGAMVARYEATDTSTYCCGAFAKWSGGPIEDSSPETSYICGDTAAWCRRPTPLPRARALQTPERRSPTKAAAAGGRLVAVRGSRPCCCGSPGARHRAPMHAGSSKEVDWLGSSSANHDRHEQVPGRPRQTR